jgi:hypothetical protein
METNVTVSHNVDQITRETVTSVKRAGHRSVTIGWERGSRRRMNLLTGLPR